MTTAEIRLRISSDIKDDAEAVFQEMGMTTTEAMRMFLSQCINIGGLPFTPSGKRPNQQTLLSFQEEEQGEHTSYSIEEFEDSLKSL